MKKKIIAIGIIVIFLLLNFSTINTATTIIKTEEPGYHGETINSYINTGSSCAVIVCGGEIGSSYWEYRGQYFKDILTNLSYNVKFLTTPHVEDVQDAIENWVPNNIGEEKKLFLLFLDHGTPLGFVLRMNEYGVNKYLTPRKLATIMDNIKDIYSTCTIVMECCFSGIFVPYLSGQNRIIITSSSAYQVSQHDDPDPNDNDETYWPIFTKPFFEALKEGLSYGMAWEKADKSAYEHMIRVQPENNPWLRPLIDDNGNSYGAGSVYPDLLLLKDSNSEWDGYLALKTYPDGNGPDNQPPGKPDQLNGPAVGNINDEQTYSVTAFDPDGHQLKYCFDWGDGSVTWTEFVNSNEETSVLHSWDKSGSYQIRVIARDEYGSVSEWSDPLAVSMSRNKSIVKLLILRFFELFPNAFPILRILFRGIKI